MTGRARRGLCDFCGHDRALRQDGTVRVHDAAEWPAHLDRIPSCLGSRLPPRPGPSVTVAAERDRLRADLAEALRENARLRLRTADQLDASAVSLREHADRRADPGGRARRPRQTR